MAGSGGDIGRLAIKTLLVITAAVAISAVIFMVLKNNEIFAKTTIEGDIYSQDQPQNISIGENAVISSSGNIESVSSAGRSTILKGYRAKTLTVNQKAEMQKAIKRLRENRAKNINEYECAGVEVSANELTRINFADANPEGAICQYIGDLTVNLSATAGRFSGKGTIIVTGNVTIKSDIRAQASSDVLGIISQQGTIFIENNVKSINATVFYSMNDIVIN